MLRLPARERRSPVAAETLGPQQPAADPWREKSVRAARRENRYADVPEIAPYALGDPASGTKSQRTRDRGIYRQTIRALGQ